MKILYIVFAILLSFNVLADRAVKSSQPSVKLEVFKSEAGTYAKSDSAYCVTIGATADITLGATSIFDATAHEFESGDKIRVVTTDASLPNTMTAGTDYWIEDTSADTFRLGTTKTKALTDPDLILTSKGDGDHSFCLNAFKSEDHGFIDGERVQVTTTVTVPTGIAVLTDYWVIKIDKDSFDIKSAYENTESLAWTSATTDTTASGILTVTRTDDFAGLSKRKVTLTASETGVYIVDKVEGFAADDDTAVFITPLTDNCHARVRALTKSQIVVNTVAANDGTTEKDCFFNLLFFGTGFAGSYE